MIAVNRDGRVLRSWGNGMYKIPHSIRIDPAGNVWTVDAASSMVYKFAPEGKLLMKIDVGGQPANPRSPFCGTTDITFAPGGHLFISDGYANARVLEYDAAGKKIAEWGKPGTGAGEFHLPHGIAIGSDNTLYVADRENARIQRFDLKGRYLGEWSGFGRPFSLKMTRSGELWAGTQPRGTPNGVECWLIKLDSKTGRILGAVETGGHHSVEVDENGQPITGERPDKVLWFRRRS